MISLKLRLFKFLTICGLLGLVLSLWGQEMNLTVHAAAPTSGLVGYWKFDEGSGATTTGSSGSSLTLSYLELKTPN